MLTKLNSKLLFLLIFCLAMGGGFSSSSHAADALLINGAGATFPYPIYSKWFDEFGKSHPDLHFNYQSVGSGAGIRQVSEMTVDFGATDGPMNDDQLKASKQKLLHFPTVIGADVPTYNIPEMKEEINFTGEVLAKIFL
ncbi:MAG: substrate-binding domain-containing protein, partial [Nitrospiria bacterium]